MKRIFKNILHTTRILCLMPFLLLIAAPGPAQMTNPESQVDKKSESPELSLYTELGLEYTDNVYRLTEDQILTMEINDQEDVISGRFNDMDSISDYIIEPRIGIRLNSDSPLGGELRLISWIRYNYYMENQKCDFPEGRIRLRNSIKENGALTLEGNFLYGFRKKNYLSGANDININGNIAKDERTYSSATYDEYEGIIAYEHEFIKNKEKQISELDIRPFIGYLIRRYNSPFGNRDKDIVSGGLGLHLEFINRVDLELNYQYEGVSSPDSRELILFDETRFLTDVNGDRIRRRNAPLVTNIDRSADRQTIEINSSLDLSKDALFFIGYRKRTSKYTSDNQLDIEHYNQKAFRERIRSGIRYDFLNSWSAEAEYSRTKNEDEEDGVYSQNNFMFSIRYNFNWFSIQGDNYDN